MKVRVSLDDFHHLACSGSCSPSSPFGVVFCPTPQVCPRPDDNMAHQSVSPPLSENDYNHLSIKDVQTFAQFKNMDVLHKADAIASYYHRGSRLRSSLSKEGMPNFVKHYSAEK